MACCLLVGRNAGGDEVLKSFDRNLYVRLTCTTHRHIYANAETTHRSGCSRTRLKPDIATIFDDVHRSHVEENSTRNVIKSLDSTT